MNQERFNKHSKKPDSIYLWEVLPKDFPRWAQEKDEFYWQFEDRVEIWLAANDYYFSIDPKKANSFFTLERDSFGPLSRGISVVTPTKERKILWYG